MLDALRASRTLGEAMDIRRELAEASRMFSPQVTEVDTRPVHVLWEILAAASAGAATAHLSGGSASEPGAPSFSRILAKRVG
jgi:hypothetical protein